jgi:hypothetical protein
MSREDEIKNEIHDVKGPPTKNYAAILLVVAAVLGVYFLFSYVLVPSTVQVIPSEQVPAGIAINNAADAAAVASNLQNSMSSVSSDIDYVGNMLGA